MLAMPDLCYLENAMSIPNVKRYRITSPDGSMTASGLRKEARKGRLIIERTTGKDYTTLPYNEVRARHSTIRVVPSGQPVIG